MNQEDINYLDYGTPKKGTIVLLHGWGQNIKMMDMLGHPFEKEYRIIVIDLPGFGDTPEPPESWSIEEYANFLHDFLTNIKVKDPILIGHSFGGRISIYYGSKYDVNKIILLAAPFRPSKKSKVTFKTKMLKMAKKIKILAPLENYAKSKIGSTDYRNASVINRGTLVKTVNTDLTENAKNIKCPVLIINGTKDTASLIEDARELCKLIKNAGIVEYEGGTHYAYLERLNQTISVIDIFINDKGGK